MAGEKVCNLVDDYVFVDENIFFCDKNFTLLNLVSEQDTLMHVVYNVPIISIAWAAAEQKRQ